MRAQLEEMGIMQEIAYNMNETGVLKTGWGCSLRIGR
jgi:hypothetical protein